jgi:dipeptidyl aminopeptidase/acylaminoacyl peptidase
VVPEIAATAIPTAEPLPESAVLPAPLYFVLPPDGQLWRLEQDGTRMSAITHETAPVADYDISPADGSLAYVSGNDLIRADALGGNRVVLVNGPDTLGDEQLNREVSSPRWSPDGRQVAFGLAGINLIEADGVRAPRLILQNDPVPVFDGSATEAPEPVEFYRPVAWSPEGARLLVEIRHFPHGGAWLALDPASGAEQRVLPPEGFACCDATWSLDGRYIYFANEQPGMISSGLWRGEVETGAVTTLVEGFPATGVSFVRSPRQLADGNLYYFLAVVPDIQPERVPLAMVRAAPSESGLGEPETLAEPDFVIGDVLWDPAARGALVVRVAADAALPAAGDLIWVPASGEDPVNLTSNALQPRWGRP